MPSSVCGTSRHLGRQERAEHDATELAFVVDDRHDVVDGAGEARVHDRAAPARHEQLRLRHGLAARARARASRLFT